MINNSYLSCKIMMKNTVKWLHRNIYWINPILVLLMFLLPFLENVINEKYSKVPIIWIGIVIVIILEIIVTYEEYVRRREELEKNEIDKKNERAKIVLSHLNLLYEEKTEILRESTYSDKIKRITKEEILDNGLFYNVHSYMREICLNLRSTIAAIIKEDTEYVDVTMIYKYRGESKWKWIIGKSGVSGATDLNVFVAKKGTLFEYMLDSDTETPVFYNKKEKLMEEGHYDAGRRDRIFKNRGSVMALMLTYFNNEKALIDAILLISTYGVRFVKTEEDENEEIDKFKTILNYEILPYYVSLLQSEMGAMYLRHVYKNSQENRDNKIG